MLVSKRPRPGAGLDAFFSARAIAIIGASGDSTKIGGRPVHLLRKHGYRGEIYPINPRGGEIQGLPAYTSVLETPQAPELAVLATPVGATVAALRECAERGVRAAIVLTAGFAEAGPEGVALQAELVAVARQAGMRLLGPNCLGAVNVADAVIGSFSISLEEHMPPAGSVGIVSQSGNIGSDVMQTVAQRGLGVSCFMATGNEADVDVADGIAALVADPATQVVLCCMETCRDGQRLIDALEQARTAGKPVIVLKIGATEQGQAAAASHTGALAGSDAVIDAVFRRHGALRVHSIEALLDIGHAVSLLGPERLPRGNGVTLVAASGGFGIMMADAMVKAGLALPALSQSVQVRIRAAVPIAGTNNPVDASAQMSSKPEILFQMLSALSEEPGSDATVLLTSLALHNSRLRRIYLEALAQIRQEYPDKLLVVISRGPADAVRDILALGIPVFPSIEAAAAGMAGLVRLGGWSQAGPATRYTGAVEALPAEVFRNEYHAKQALAAAGIEVLPEAWARSPDEAVAHAETLGYPVVLKVLSADIPHKTEIGGVMLRLADEAQVRAAYATLLERVARLAPQARLDGILVAPMAGEGTELIAGISRDPVFGPVVMVGMGGVFAEVLRDVAVQAAPVSEVEALAMLRQLKLFPVLDGARGRPKADVAVAARMVARLSEFACRHVDDVVEIDMNPLLVGPSGQGAVVLDALMVPAPSAPSQS